MKNNGVDTNLQTHPVLTVEKYELTHLHDDKFSMQQAQSVYVVHHNTLPRDEIITLLNHNVCSRLRPTGYLNRLIFVVEVMFGIRPTAMVEFTLNQFHFDSLSEKPYCFSWKRLGHVLVLRSKMRVEELR